MLSPFCSRVRQKIQQGVALMGHNTTGLLGSVGRPTAHVPGRRRADCPHARQLAGPFAGRIIDDDRQQPAKQY